MYSSPCHDHLSCPLDLGRLRADLSALARRMREPIEPLLAKEVAAREALTASPADPALRVALDVAARDVREFRATHSKERVTLLCAIRAHHRGRVHRRFERLPDGKVRACSLEDQARLIFEDPERTFERYLRRVARA
jgi:hypothetical protein